MLERLIIWSIFGVTLSLTPLVVVAFMTWDPAGGVLALFRLVLNEELLAIALTLGGAASAGVLIHNQGHLRVLKILAGGLTFLATLDCMGAFVVIKSHTNHLGPDGSAIAVGCAALTTLVGAMICEVLMEA